MRRPFTASPRPESESRSTYRGRSAQEDSPHDAVPRVSLFLACGFAAAVRVHRDAACGLFNTPAIPQTHMAHAEDKRHRAPHSSAASAGPVPMLQTRSRARQRRLCLADVTALRNRLVAHRDTLDANDLDIGHADKAQQPCANGSWKSYGFIGPRNRRHRGQHQDCFLPWTSPIGACRNTTKRHPRPRD